ncbi:MAG: response regulator [Verrucomicrobiales bacterium]|nr:response regulator [Verrucomicrobiales bacterium]
MNKRKILVIDDDLQFGKLTRLNLEQTGFFDVSIENDSTKAIDTAREFKPDLILLDIVMPGLDGGDVERLLKEDAMLKDVPILVVSAIVSEADLPPGGDGGKTVGDDFMVPKTINPSLLIEIIESRLGGGGGESAA